MVLDYKKISDEKRQEYGTKVGNYGRLLASLYADRAHFILELLQNAEDAIKNRGTEWNGSRAVSFRLTKGKLRFEHSGRPFNEADVRGICEIGESEKAEDVTAIGRFGIGFKSVYAITDRPEIHSGPEDFAIENYVWPVAVPAIERDADDTVFLFPLKADEESAYDEIVAGLRELGASTLLFLRQIEEVQWRIEDGRSGHYLRETETVEDGIRKVTVIGEEFGQKDVSEGWLVFSRPVATSEGKSAGHVEIAFSLDTETQRIQPVSDSRLVAFFPTSLTTHVGFLMQGPYQTTPSRDNVPSREPWNKCLVEETSELLVHALRWLRDKGDLTTDVLSCLPLRLGTSPMFMFDPLFDATKQALSTEKLLPSLNSEYVSADRALLGRGEDLRQLFSASQLAELYGDDGEMSWLSGDISQDRTPEIRTYIMEELGVEEVTPGSITRKLSRTFLEGQHDGWIEQLYGFLGRQQAIINRLNERQLTVPLIRLTNGRHVSLGEGEVFLPGEGETDLPTVSRSVCSSTEALRFLRGLKLREADLVDDVIRNLLPKYRRNEPGVDDAEYEADFGRVLRAYATDSIKQRQSLLDEIQKSKFVRLEDRTHVSLREKQVYLPGKVKTDLPTVCRSVCSSDEAKRFLRALGLKEPDLVADVIQNVLPKYRGGGRRVDAAEYGADIGRIAKAYAEADASVRADAEFARFGLSFPTQAAKSRARREGLLAELRKSSFVRTVDAGTAKNRLSKPDDVYLPTERLKRLFDGVAGVWFVDYRWDCLRGKGVQALLEACGSSHLKAVSFDPNFTWMQLIALRGVDGSTRDDTVRDRTIRGLNSLLRQMEALDPKERREKAALLWESLVDFVENGGERFLKGSYEYFYYSKRVRSFAADSVNRLNDTAWIPSEDGSLRRPKEVDFDSLEWEDHPILRSHITFKPPTPPIVDTLAKQAGIDPEAIAFMLEKGITLDELKAIRPDSVDVPPPSLPISGGSSDPADPFAKELLRVQTTSPSSGSGNPITLPPGGPKTRESARRDTSRSGQVGRTESHRVRLAAKTELGPQGKALADEFHNMVTGDYGKRCQICSRTFVRTGGGWQVNVVHVVPPRDDHRTNHFGDLLGLCGWHFNLMQYGQWALLDPDTGQPFKDANESLGWERMRDAILNREQDMDDLGNLYMELPIRFFNVYQGSNADPVTINQHIRYSIPHWEYLRELLQT